MKQKKRKSGFFGKFLLTVAVVTAVTVGGVNLTYALIDETNAVHINAAEIEDATLIIGTHLIYLGSMNQQIYEVAMKSAEDSNQYSRYYKSELAGGVWYEITEAGALADITTDGIIVENSVIEALFMTHHTKSDGITYDLTDGKAVSIFDINDPYDLSNMTELNPIKLQYDTLVQTEDPSDTMERDILYIKEIYQVDRTTQRTRELDAQMKALQEYYDILIRDGGEEAMSDMVMSVLDKLDAARRVEVLEPLNEVQLQKMSQVIGREYKYLKGEISGAKVAEEETEEETEGRKKIENFVANTDLLSAISESMTNVQESYITYSSKMLAEGNTVLSKAEYDFSMELIKNAQGQNYSGCDEVVYKLIYLQCINESKIQEEEKEREFIAQELLQKAKDNYTSSLSAGVGASYQTLPSTAAAATKANALKTQLSETEIVRNELQFIMQAYIDRMTPEKGMEYFTECIDKIDDYRNKVKADAYADYAATSIDSHLDWLTKKLKDLQSLTGGSALDDLRAQKEELKTELLTALDQNKLDTAKKVEAKMAAIDKEIEETESYLNSVLNSENTSESEKALAKAGLGDGSAMASLQNMKDEALENIKNGDLDSIGNLLEGMGVLAETQPDAGMNALKDVYEELSRQKLMGEDTRALEEAMSQVEELAAGQVGNLSRDLSKDALAAAIQDFVNENMSDNWKGNQNSSANRGENGNTSNNQNDSMNQEGNGFGNQGNSANEGATGSDFQVQGNVASEGTNGNDSGNQGDSANEGANGSGSGNQGDAMNQGGNGFENQGNSANEGVNDNTSEGYEDNMNQGEDEIDLSDNISESTSTLNAVLNNLDEEQLTTVLAGLSAYSEQNDSKDIEDVLKTYSKNAVNNGNKYVCEQYRNEFNMYVPVDKLARIMGYRYIFNDSQKTVILQRGSQYYQFEAFSTEAKKGTDVEEMEQAAGFQSVIYLPAEAVQKYFGLDARKLPDTSYGIILTDEMNEMALEFVDYLLEAEEEF